MMRVVLCDFFGVCNVNAVLSGLSRSSGLRAKSGLSAKPFPSGVYWGIQFIQIFLLILMRLRSVPLMGGAARPLDIKVS